MENQGIIILIVGIIYFFIALVSAIYFWNKGEEYYQRTHGPGAEERYDVFSDPGALSTLTLFWPILFLQIGFCELFCWIKRKSKRRDTRENENKNQ